MSNIQQSHTDPRVKLMINDNVPRERERKTRHIEKRYTNALCKLKFAVEKINQFMVIKTTMRIKKHIALIVTFFVYQ